MEPKDIIAVAAAQGYNVNVISYADHSDMFLRTPDGKHVKVSGQIKKAKVSTFAQAADVLDQWTAEYEYENVEATSTPEPKPATMTRKIETDGYILGKGKMLFGTRYKVGNVTFTFQNPKNLSKKQQQVVYRFMESVDGELAGLGVSFDEYAMWIDLIFQFNRGEITQAQFESITKIKLTLSTYDSRSDHNL